MEELLAPLGSLSLEELDARAALLRRVDVKYVVGRDRLGELLERLGGDHDVLEIEGRRVFGYRSVYFDSPSLRCFREHGAGVKPRFKARTRTYVDAGDCVFEVKLKPAGGGTDKRQAGHPRERADVITPAAERLLGAALGDLGIDPPGELSAVLQTSFRRVTLAAEETDARVTVDDDVALSRMDGTGVRLDRDRVLVETKSEDGKSPADEALSDLGATAVSISKYRVGIDALLARDRTGELDEVRDLFG